MFDRVNLCPFCGTSLYAMGLLSCTFEDLRNEEYPAYVEVTARCLDCNTSVTHKWEYTHVPSLSLVLDYGTLHKHWMTIQFIERISSYKKADASPSEISRRTRGRRLADVAFTVLKWPIPLSVESDLDRLAPFNVPNLRFLWSWMLSSKKPEIELGEYSVSSPYYSDIGALQLELVRFNTHLSTGGKVCGTSLST